MTRRGRRLFDVEEPRIEIIPMIDIMMFLLVFFIVITLDRIANTGIRQQLPQMAQKRLEKKQLVVSLAADGALALNGQAISAGALAGAFRAAKATGGEHIEVLIIPDKSVALQNVITVMDLARAERLEAIGISASERSPPSRNGHIR